jgi:hypothetical protein
VAEPVGAADAVRMRGSAVQLSGLLWRGKSCRCEAGAHGFEDALGDDGDGGFVGEDYYAALVALRYRAVLLVDAGVEGVVFALEAVFVGAGLLGGAVVAAAGSAERAG